jgi:hypothetical protein
VTNILGGGYTIEENAFLSMCSVVDQDIMVTLGSDNNKAEFKINATLTKPPRSALSAYNLWWATCKNQFQKFR